MGAGGSDGETGRSFGRRKAAAAASPSMKKKLKKVPQRGMGVEKLERQRIQQEWNKIKEINHQPLVDPMNMNLMININPNPYPASSFQHHYNSTLGGFYPQMPADLQFGVINNHLISTELSSTPNSCVTCDSQRCNACHKKKKVNSRNLGSEQQICKVGEYCGFLGMNLEDNHQMINKEENHEGLVGNIGNKGGEIVGVHRKGSSMVMEYDFFPSSNKAKVDDDDDHELVMMTSSPISPNWQLDLSLKLSN